MYLTSFVHRDRLFEIAERWFCGRPGHADGRDLTSILIADVFIIRETLDWLTRRLIAMTGAEPAKQREIRQKGELRDLLCADSRKQGPRVTELFERYRHNPAYYYQETPISASVFLDGRGRILGSFRVKRPKRIAEKANRRIADWIYGIVNEVAEAMARQRAERFGVPLEQLLTPQREMEREFIEAEEVIASSFRNSTIQFDRNALMIQDTGAVKIVSDEAGIDRLIDELQACPGITVLEQERFQGRYQALNLVLEVPWDRESVCRKFRDARAWEQVRDRGIPASELKMGLEPLIAGASPRISIEVILTTFSDLVESELGNSIHEERIITQRYSSRYRGYIPMNVEFLVEFLFAFGFSPRTELSEIPIKMWGRYLPETLGMYIRQLYDLPAHDFFG